MWLVAATLGSTSLDFLVTCLQHRFEDKFPCGIGEDLLKSRRKIVQPLEESLGVKNLCPLRQVLGFIFVVPTQYNNQVPNTEGGKGARCRQQQKFPPSSYLK
jgi:hypothetical protein